jgi:hypothetical protein
VIFSDPARVGETHGIHEASHLHALAPQETECQLTT